jgi:hypothetical protein
VTYWATDKLGHVSEGTLSFAIKDPQTISVSVPAVVSYGGKPKFTGSLKSAAGAMAGRRVFVEAQNGSAWTKVAETTTTPTGTYTVYGPALTAAKSLRVVGEGDATYATVRSSSKLIKPYASLGTPSASSTQTYGRSYTTYGYIQPYHSTSNSNKVKISAYRYESGKWVYRKSFTTAYKYYSSTKTKYSASVKLPYKGKWRIRAYHATDSTNYKTYSGYRYVTVK